LAELVSKGLGFPAIHSDRAGYEMLLQMGYDPEDARDWSNCGCVVPHFRKTGEWTSAVNVNFGAALEYALNQGKSRLSGKPMGLPEKPIEEFAHDVSTPLAVMRSAAKVNHDLHSGGTLLNLRLNKSLVDTPRGRRNLAAMIQAYFSLGAFHVQFNTISTEVLRKAQA